MDRRDAAHLLRRTGFGASAAEIDRVSALDFEDAVEEICTLGKPDAGADAVPAPTFDTAGLLAARRSGDRAVQEAAREQLRQERRALVGWWLRRMVAADRPFQEKLTFLWHDHFATSMQKVEVPELMFRHQQTLHDLGPGRFDQLVSAIARDPAMLIWLDGVASTAEAPNENFARELFELFTLGHGGTAHGGHEHGQPYTERDIQEAARALTGWVIDRNDGSTSKVPARHDAGTKTVLGSIGTFDLDDVVRLATHHEACAPHVVARLYSRLARPVGPDDPVVKELAAPFARDLDTARLLRGMFLHPDFRSDASRTALVKTPLEYVIGTVRALALGDLDERVGRLLGTLGQVPLLPPDVSGWPANEAWLSTQTALARLTMADTIAQGVAVPSIADAAPSERPDAVAHVLGVDRWSTPTSEALRAGSGDPTHVLTVALVSPEYLLN
jgi:uncharacterized protein (DUF1800 family)